MRYILPFLLLFSIFSCVDSAIVAGNARPDKDKTSSKDATDDIEKIGVYDNKKLVLMFFEGYQVYPRRRPNVTPSQKNGPTVPKMPKHYSIRYIADWLKDGKRYVKFKDMQTNIEYVVDENSKTGYITVVERSLFYYKIKIEDEIIEVKR